MNNIWEEVRDKVDIVDVISEYVPDVKAAGVNYKCLSPFRKEKTPSMVISPQKQIWHDFGSGDGGDVFGFVAQIENINKWEALKKLAKIAGIEVPEKTNYKKDKLTKEEVAKEESHFVKGQKMLAWVTDIYHKLLLRVLQDREHPITQYCIERRLSQKTIEQFKLGYAPKNKFILNLAKKYKLPLGILYEAGILKFLGDSTKPKDEILQEIKNNPSSVSDKFVDRLMIPVFDKNGSPVGFTGRVLPYDKSERPKYLNSPQTEWFDKGKLWFGWHLSKKEIMMGKRVIIVEGNMDVVAAFSHNLPFVLASQGTSFTINQLKLLKQVTKTVWLAFDNDSAGQIASQKFFKSATSLGLTVKKVVIDEKYKDLDDLLSDSDRDSFDEEQLVVRPFLDYLLNKKQLELTNKDAEKQKEAILEIVDMLIVLDEISLEQYLKRLSTIAGIGLNTLQRVAEQQKGKIRKDKNLEKEIEKDDRKESDAYDQALVAFQKMVAFYDNFKEKELISQDRLFLYFTIIKKLLGSRIPAEDLEEYVASNQSIFELIWNEEIESKTEDFFGMVRGSLDRFVDSNVTKLVMDQEAYELYLKLKSQ